MMNNFDLILNKIKKLLKLSKDSGATDAEKLLALEKAKELMMKYNIDQLDKLQDDEELSRNVKDHLTDISYSIRVEPWIIELAKLIASNTRCVAYRHQKYRAKRRYIGFVGLENDLKICIIMFNYAIYGIWDELAVIRNKLYQIGIYRQSQLRYYTDGYALGFIRGMEKVFNHQNEANKNNEKWLMVIKTPVEVSNYVNDYFTTTYSNAPSIEIDPQEYDRGLRDGQKWKPIKSIEENN